MGIRSYMMPNHLDGETLRKGDRFRVGLIWFSVQKSFFKAEDENESLSQKNLFKKYIDEGAEKEFFKRVTGYEPVIDSDGEFHVRENDYKSLTKLAKIFMRMADYKLQEMTKTMFGMYLRKQSPNSGIDFNGLHAIG